MKLKKLLALILALAMVLTSLPLALAEDVAVEAPAEQPAPVEVPAEEPAPEPAPEPVAEPVAEPAPAEELEAAAPVEAANEVVSEEPVAEPVAEPAPEPAEELEEAAPVEAANVVEEQGTHTVFVTFMVEGQQYGDVVQKEVGDKLEKPADPTPSSSDYKFTGKWLYNGEEWDFANRELEVEGNMTLEAEIVAKQYTITFDLGEGTGTAKPITLNFGAEITEADYKANVKEDTLAIEGGTFAGWEPEVPATMPSGGLTCVAKWDMETYTATFYNGYEPQETVASQTYQVGDTLAQPEKPTREGYSFVEWTPEIPETMPASDTEFAATWSINRYTATFYYGYEGAPAPVEVKGDYKSALTAPELEREGYELVGWDKEVPANMPGEDTEYTAQWILKNNLVKFVDSGDGLVEALEEDLYPTEDKFYDFGEEIADPGWEREGYTITWTDENKQEVIFPAEMGENAMTFTASWTPIEYDYTFIFGDDNNTVIGPETVKYGDPIPQPALEGITKEGFTFEKWNKEVPDLMPAEDLVFTGVWKEDIIVTFHLDGQDEGGLVFSDPIAPTPEAGEDFATILDGKTFAQSFVDGLPTAVRKGYKLVWKKADKTVFTNNDPVTESIDLYSYWEELTWTVTFDVNGGDPAPEDQIIHDQDLAVEPAPEPTKEGYKFLGWYNGNTKYNFANPVTTDLDLTAKWDNLVWTVQALDPDAKVTETGVKIETTIDEDNVVSSTVEFTELAQWQNWVAAEDAQVDLGNGWYVGVRLTAPVDNTQGAKGVSAGDGAFAANSAYDYWTLITVDKVRAALEDDGFIKDKVTAILGYDGDQIEQVVEIAIDVRNTTLKQDPDDKEDIDFPNAIVTANGEEDTIDVLFDPTYGAFDGQEIPVDEDGIWHDNIFVGNVARKPMDPVCAGMTFRYWADAAGNELKFDEETPWRTVDTFVEGTTFYAVWEENWWLTAAINPDGSNNTNEGVTIDGDTITFTDYNAWRQSVAGEGEEPAWEVGVRFNHLEDLDTDGMVDFEPKDAWSSYEYTPYPKCQADAWLTIDPDHISELLAAGETSEEVIITLDDTNVFTVVLDYTNIDLLAGDEHMYVVENGVEQWIPVTFDPDNESEPFVDGVWKYNKIAQPEPDPDKEGYAFAGWFTIDEEGNLVEPYDFENTPVTEAFTLKACWYALWTMEPAVAEGGTVKKNKMTVSDIQWEKWNDKKGKEDWVVGVKFIGQDTVDMDGVIVDFNGEAFDDYTVSGHTLTAHIHLDEEQVREWATSQDCKSAYEFVIHNDELDYEGQIFNVEFDVTDLILLDSTDSVGHQNYVVVEDGIVQDMWVTFNTDGGAPEIGSVMVVKYNYVDNPGAVKREHYNFVSWRKVLENGELEAQSYVWATPVIEDFTLQPKWNHGYWDVDEVNIENAWYDAEERTMHFENTVIPYDEEVEGYLVRWNVICPDSLEDEEAREQMRVKLPGENQWRKFNDVVTGTIPSGQYYIDGFYTITEEEMLELAANEEHKKLVYQFAPKGNEGDAVKITIDICPENMKFIKWEDEGELGYWATQTKIRNWKQVWEVCFDGIQDDEYDVVDGECAKPLDPEPTWEGWAFAGWFIWDDEAEALVPYDFEQPVYEHTFLWSQWTELATVTFYDEAGEIFDEKEVAVGTDAEEVFILVPEKLGFSGAWYDLDTLEPFDWESTIEEDKELFPVYEPLEGIVDYQGMLVNFRGEIRLGIQLRLNAKCDDEQYADYKVVFTRGETVTEVPFADATEVEIEKYKYRFYAPVPIRYWDEEVTIQIMNGDEVVAFYNDREVDPNYGTFVDSAVASVKEYAESETGTATMVALKKALKVYALAFGNYAKGEKNAIDVSGATFTGIDETVKGLDGEVLPEGLTLAGHTVNFKAGNALKVVYTVAEGHSIDEYTFTIDGTEVEPTLREGTTNSYEIMTPYVSAKNLADKHTFVVTDGVEKFTVIASCMTYCKTIQNSSNEDMRNLAKALYLYYKAADAQLN